MNVDLGQNHEILYPRNITLIQYLHFDKTWMLVIIAFVCVSMFYRNSLRQCLTRKTVLQSLRNLLMISEKKMGSKRMELAMLTQGKYICIYFIVHIYIY